MKYFSSFKSAKDAGYVALEFVLAMGMMVVPTALIVLQIPGVLEQHDRASAVASRIANVCADEADDNSEAQQLALKTANEEMNATSVLRHSSLSSAECIYESGNIEPGTKVHANISISVPAPLLPFVGVGTNWTLREEHVAIVPQYRSFEEQ